jgi:hypothetical protein
MNPKFRDALIAALEVPPDEGGYTKTANRLVREGPPGQPDRFCCLGVAANEFDLWEKEGYNQWDLLNDDQLARIGMTQCEQKELARINDRNETFEQVVTALRGM